MIINNRIIFGHGTVLVGVSVFPAAITFCQSATAHSVGETIDADFEESGETISIPFDLTRDKELRQKLLQVESREIDSFSFCGYIFDFSSYNPESIRVIRGKAITALYEYLIPLAC